MPYLLMFLLLFQASPAPAQQQDEVPPLRLTVVEGEGSINNIRQGTSHPAMVLVEDENQNALAGVAVTFFLPNDGPSGLFPNDSRIFTAFTDAKGVAQARNIRFNNSVGIMKIGVTATLFSKSVTASITQTNISSATTQKASIVTGAGVQKIQPVSHGISKKKVIIALIVAGAAASAAIVLTNGSKPGAVITSGTATVGAPK